mgnify:FL=1
MTEYFLTNLEEMTKLAKRINSEDPSLIKDTATNNKNTLKDSNENGLMSKQAKQFARISKHYDRSQLQALSLADSMNTIQNTDYSIKRRIENSTGMLPSEYDKKLAEEEKKKDDNLRFNQLTTDFNLKDDKEKNPFTNKVLFSGEQRKRLYGAIETEVNKNIVKTKEGSSLDATLNLKKTRLKMNLPNGKILNSTGREVGALIKGKIVLSDDAVLTGSVSTSRTKNKTKLSSFNSKRYGQLTVIDMGLEVNDFELNIRKLLENKRAFTKGTIAYEWENGNTLTAFLDTNKNKGFKFERGNLNVEGSRGGNLKLGYKNKNKTYSFERDDEKYKVNFEMKF